MAKGIKEFERHLTLEGYSGSTINQYTTAFKYYHGDLKGSIENIQDFMEERMIDNETKKPKPLNAFFKGFLNVYILFFELPYKIPKPKRKGSGFKKPYKFLTNKEIYIIINNTPLRISLITRLFFETGLRLRELIDIELDNIELENMRLVGVGKGDKPFNVDISNKTTGILSKFLEKNRKKHPFHEEEKRRDDARSYYYFLKKYGLKLLNKKIHPHMIRHALGHYLRTEKKWDLPQIKKMLRHSRLETTAIYTEATEQEIHKKMRDEVLDQENDEGK